MRTPEQIPPSPILRGKAWKFYRQGEPEVRLLGGLVRRGANSIDVGAAEGLYTYFLSKISSRVFAYEPNPCSFEFLRRTAAANVVFSPIALSRQAVSLAIFAPALLSGPSECGAGAFSIGRVVWGACFAVWLGIVTTHSLRLAFSGIFTSPSVLQ